VVTDGFVSITLEPTLDAPAIARSFAAEVAGSLPEDELDALRLLVSEAVTDAVEHHSTWVNVGIEPAAPRTRVEISDDTRDVDIDGRFAHGYGRRMLDRFATRWGVDPSAGGRRLWFELRPR
jgi:hypothetical protein